jgi:predicted DNA-binding WGR domain protein
MENHTRNQQLEDLWIGHNTDNGSDKIYAIGVYHAGSLYQAVAFWGARGSNYRSEVKTTTTSRAVAYSDANKLQRAKHGRGYHELRRPYEEWIGVYLPWETYRIQEDGLNDRQRDILHNLRDLQSDRREATNKQIQDFIDGLKSRGRGAVIPEQAWETYCTKGVSCEKLGNNKFKFSIDLGDHGWWYPHSTNGLTRFPAVGNKDKTMTIYWATELEVTVGAGMSLPIVQPDNLEKFSKEYLGRGLVLVDDDYYEFTGVDVIHHKTAICDFTSVHDSLFRLYCGSTNRHMGFPRTEFRPRGLVNISKELGFLSAAELFKKTKRGKRAISF